MDLGADETLVVTHRVVIHETDLEGRLATFRTTCPKGETIGGSLLDGDTEETFILETCELIAVARVFEAYIVRIALERSSFVLHVEVSEGAPTHQVLGELERAVLHHLGIESAIGSVVDILKKDTIHRRLYGCPEFLGVDVQYVVLSRSRQACSQEQECCQFSHISSVISLNRHKIRQKI